MNINSYQSNLPTPPKEDRPNATLIKTLIVLAIVCGGGWFINEKVKDGSVGQFFSDIADSFVEDEQDSELSPEVRKEIEDYLSDKYNDNCEYASKATINLPDGASGGLFKCDNVSSDVYAYAEGADGDYTFQDGYLFAKYHWMTEASFSNTIKLYFPEAEVKLTNSTYGISTYIDKDEMFFNFVRENNYFYEVNVDLPRDTAININELTSLSGALTMTFPNYRADAYIESSVSEKALLFSIKSEDGKAGVTVNQ